MNWKDMPVPKKIFMGFGITTIIIAGIVVMNFKGVKGIVNNASEVIDGNKLKGVLVQREVDHLDWAMKVNNFLADDRVTELKVETDDHKCGFGKFLYGKGRKEAERLVPGLAPIFISIEKSHRELHESAIAIDKVFDQTDINLPQLFAEKETEHLKWMSSITSLFLDNKKKLEVTTDPHKCGLGKWLYGESARKAAAGNHEMGRLIEDLKKPHKKLHDSAVKIQNTYRQIHPDLIVTLMARLDDHRKWALKVGQKIVNGSKSLEVQIDPNKCAVGKFLVSDQVAKWMRGFPEFRSAIDALKNLHNKLHKSATEIEKELLRGNRAKAEKIYNEKTVPALEHVAVAFNNAMDAEKKVVQARNNAKHFYDTTIHKFYKETHGVLLKLKAKAVAMLRGMKKAQHIYIEETKPALQETKNLIHRLIRETENNIITDKVMFSAAQSVKKKSSIVGIIGIILGIVIAFFIARSVTTVLTRISSQLNEGAEHVASASGQVSSASQQLAEGASEQAASIEETSSSLEEMSSMTKQNADNASQADSLMKETNQVVGQANDSMNELTTSMEEIFKASEETSKIIKTIDEIAFQTNLLALNAAVEAARAGEAGAGFAVVAEEVRNLAMRSAEAAKSTAVLIEGTVKKVSDGSELVAKTKEAFGNVSESSKKVGELVGEISASSGEQAEGIEQINKAVAEMDKVVQQNASNAEESASASEEMNAQTETMKSSVDELVAMVGESGKGNDRPIGGSMTKPVSHPTHHALSVSSPARNARSKQISVNKVKKVAPDKIIPMDDDFRNF